MKLLLDTHIVLALVEDRLDLFDPTVTARVSAPGSVLHASVASLWEITIKWRLGKLDLRTPPELLAPMLRSGGIVVLAIEDRHVVTPCDPIPETRDPFDRLLLSICRSDGLVLVTADRALVGHPMCALSGPPAAGL